MKQITLDEAEKLALETDYAVFAVGVEINTADAGAFFLEGYRHCLNQIESAKPIIPAKNTKFNKRHFTIRIISLPFVFAIIFIAHNLFVLKRTWHYLRYGGEYVNYEENERENMAGIFEMLKEIRSHQTDRFKSPEDEFLEWELWSKRQN